MPYIIALVSRKSYTGVISDRGFESYSNERYAQQPNIKSSETTACCFDVIPLAVKDDLVDIDYFNLYSQTRLCTSEPGFNDLCKVLYCFKVDSYNNNSDRYKPVKLNIKSPKEIIGCIAFSTPRISDGRSHYTTHALAEKTDREAFVASVVARYKRGGFVKELILNENKHFEIPEILIKPKDEPKPLLSDAAAPPSPAAAGSGILNFFSGFFNRTIDNSNKELDELFSRAKQNPELSKYLLAQAQEFDKKADTLPSRK